LRHGPVGELTIKRQLVVATVLFAAMISACIAMQVAFDAGNRGLVKLFGVLGAFFCMTSTLTYFVAVVRYNEREAKERKPIDGTAQSHVGDYTAKHCIYDRVVAVVLSSSFALVTGFFYAHSGYLGIKILCSGMFVFWVAMTYRHFFTRVRFTDEKIVVDVQPFIHFSESYKSITSVRAQPGNLRIQFADRRVLNIAAGLGDSAIISSILAERVDILPE
jgi:hypothetical protein